MRCSPCVEFAGGVPSRIDIGEGDSLSATGNGQLERKVRSPDLWENEVAPISVIGTAGEGVDELEVGPGVRQLGGVELG